MLDFILKYWLEFFLGLLSSGVVALARSIQKEHQKSRDIGIGVQALLRDRIFQSGRYFVDEVGYCPLNEKANVEKLYTAYHNLGGNDVASDVYKKILALPTEPPEEKKGKDD